MTTTLEAIRDRIEAIRARRALHVADLKAAPAMMGHPWYTDRLELVEAMTAEIIELEGREWDMEQEGGAA